MFRLLAAGSLIAIAVAPAVAQSSDAQTAVPESLRPPTLNAGKVELHGSLPVFKFEGDSDAIILAGVGGSFGISDQLELGGDYAFLAAPSNDAAGLFAAHIRYRMVNDEKMSAALGGALLFSNAADATEIGLGISLRYRLSNALSIYTSSSGIPLCGGCLQILGPVTGQLVMARQDGETLIALNLPVGIGLQASPNLYIFGETSLATVLLSPDTASLVEFQDYIGMHIGGWLSAGPNLDLGIGFANDLKHPSDVYLVEFRARILL